MSEHDQIVNLKSQFNTARDKELQKKILDSLLTYGENGITVISDLISNPFVDSEVKTYGLDLINNYRKSH